MPYTLYDASVGLMIPGLETLSALIKKAEAHAAAKGLSAEELLQARLHEDMRPLSFQVHVVTDLVNKAVARCEGVAPAEWSDDLETVADCEARIGKALAVIKAASREKIDGGCDDMVTMNMGNRTVTMAARSYINAFSLPNFFFHLTTTYAILRNRGVELGKMDYLTPYVQPVL